MRLLLLLLLTLNLLNAQKIALLIGNSNYQHLDRLTSPSQDIPALAKKLGDMNFEVTELYNLDEKQMKKAIKTFQQKLYHKPNAIALFYYSGHGSQAYGESYLIPIDGDTRDQADVEADGVKVETIARKMATARTKANILFLDACRDVPTGTMGGTKGLGQVNRQPSSTLILYSTSKNKTAKDDRVFNKIVLEKLALNMPFASLANDISYTVGQKTNKQQVPELLSTGLPMLYLNTSSIPLVLKPEIKIIEREKIVYRNKPQEIVVTPNPITIFNNNSSNNKTAVVNGLMFQDVFCLTGSCQEIVTPDNSKELARLQAENARLREQQNRVVQPVEPATQETRRLDSSTNTSKWITPTNSVCKANGGKIYKGVCQANWKNAKKVCSQSGGRLPSREDFHNVITACGGIADADNNQQWAKNEKNSSYQSCYKQKGFSDNDWYWTRESHEEYSSNPWGVHFRSGNDFWGNKTNLNYALCVR